MTSVLCRPLLYGRAAAAQEEEFIWCLSAGDLAKNALSVCQGDLILIALHIHVKCGCTNIELEACFCMVPMRCGRPRSEEVLIWVTLVPHPVWQHHWAISGSSEGSILKSSHEVSNPVLGKPPHGSGSTADRPRPSSCSPFYWRSTISPQHLPPRTAFLISNRTLRYQQSHRQRAKPPGAAEGAFDGVQFVPRIKSLLL